MRRVLLNRKIKKEEQMTEQTKKQLYTTLLGIADQLRGAMNADDFRDYILSFLFLRYLSDNYEASAKKALMQQLFLTLEEVQR